MTTLVVIVIGFVLRMVVPIGLLLLAGTWVQRAEMVTQGR